MKPFPAWLFRWRRTLISLLVAAWAGLFFLPGFRVRTASLDGLLRARHGLLGVNPSQTQGVAVVYLDANQVTNSRSFLELFDALKHAGAAAIAVDIEFDSGVWNAPEARAGLERFLLEAAASAGARPKVVMAARGLTPVPGPVTPEYRVGPIDRALMTLAEDPRFAEKVMGIGLSNLDQDPDGRIRSFRSFSGYSRDSLAMTMAVLEGHPPASPWTNWINHYGPPGTLATTTWSGPSSATNLAPLVGNRVVFVGHGPPSLRSTNPASKTDRHATPLTPRFGALTGGAEIHATLYRNLMHGGETPATHLGFLTPPSGGEEAVLALGVALVVALLFPRWTPLQAVAIAAGMAVLILFVTLVVFLRFGRVLPWVSLAGLQMVAAVAASFLPLKRVFISYRIVDGLPVAQNISRGLKTRGVETFLDIDEDRSGGISAVVRSEIARSSCVLLILTPGVYTASRLDGDHVIAELDAARDSGRPVLPVWVDDVAGHLRLWQAKGHKLPPSLAKVADGQVRAEYQSALSEESIARLEMKIPASRRRAKRVPNLQSTVRPGIA